MNLLTCTYGAAAKRHVSIFLGRCDGEVCTEGDMHLAPPIFLVLQRELKQCDDTKMILCTHYGS